MTRRALLDGERIAKLCAAPDFDASLRNRDSPCLTAVDLALYGR
jgi:hypothetical protein